MIIHVVGDSHSLVFNSIAGCKVHHVGPRTMFGLRNRPLGVESFGLKESDYLLYTFGEIDVRVHIGRIRDQQQKNLDQILDDLVTNYFKVVQETTKVSCTIPVICSIVPPSNLKSNPNYPFYGTLEDRVVIQRQLNDKLKTICSTKNIKYLDYAHYYALPDGSLNHRLSDQHVHIHISQWKYIKEELDKLLQL